MSEDINERMEGLEAIAAPEFLRQRLQWFESHGITKAMAEIDRAAGEGVEVDTNRSVRKVVFHLSPDAMRGLKARCGLLADRMPDSCCGVPTEFKEDAP